MPPQPFGDSTAENPSSQPDQARYQIVGGVRPHARPDRSGDPHQHPQQERQEKNRERRGRHPILVTVHPEPVRPVDRNEEERRHQIGCKEIETLGQLAKHQTAKENLLDHRGRKHRQRRAAPVGQRNMQEDADLLSRERPLPCENTRKVEKCQQERAEERTSPDRRRDPEIPARMTGIRAARHPPRGEHPDGELYPNGIEKPQHAGWDTLIDRHHHRGADRPDDEERRENEYER